MIKTVCVFNIGVGNTQLLATKIKHWQKMGYQIRMVCPTHVVGDFNKLVDGIDYITIPRCNEVDNKLGLVVELLKRNFIGLFYIPRMIRKTEVIYSISSVLDELLLPYLIKILRGRRITWVALFENEVARDGRGNGFIRWLSFSFYRISLLLLRKADTVFAISKQLHKLLVDERINKNRIVVTGNAVDGEMIMKAIRTRRYQCDGLFMGRIDENKGVFDLVKVIILLKKEWPHFKLWLAGSGDKIVERKLLAEIKKERLGQNIKLLGYVAGFPKFRLLANSRVFLFPSYTESFGVALLEAVCSGTHAVAYELPAYKEIYQHGEITQVKRGDLGAFAQATLSILKKYSFGQLNKDGLRLAQKYTYERIASLEAGYF